MDPAAFERLFDDLLEEGGGGAVAIDTAALSRDQQGLLEVLGVLEKVREVHRGHVDDETKPATQTRKPPVAQGRWGRYELRDVLGQGGFGTVFRARDRDLDMEVALKVLRFTGDEGAERATLITEARKLAQIRHPNVVEVLPLEEHEGQVALVMRFVDGETLADVARDRTLDAREAGVIGEDICKGLVQVHAADIIHRDIKTGNVMRDRQGRIVLVDFGSGEIVRADDSRRNDPEGTPIYMAPELFAGEHASKQSDIYSVGVLLFHLVTGQHPVNGRTWSELKTAHMTGRRLRLSDARPDLPVGFRQVVEKAIAPSSTERFQSAGEMLEALEALRTLPGEQRVLARIGRALALGAAGVLIVTGLGILNSRYFNVALGRTEFADEGAWRWFEYGARACALPALITALGLAAVTVPIALWRVVRGVFSSPAPPRRAARTTLADRLAIRDPIVGGAYVLLLSVASLAVWLIVFRPELDALLTYIPDTPAATLVWLSTDHCLRRESYQISLTLIVALSIIGWVTTVRAARRRRQPLNRWLLSGGIATICLAVVLLYFPWRMFNRSEFRPATWHGESCFITGTRGDERLLFCPNLPARRNQVVNVSDVTPSGDDENLFWRFSLESTERLCQ